LANFTARTIALASASAAAGGRAAGEAERYLETEGHPSKR
jgi:hypothetical protein